MVEITIDLDKKTGPYYSGTIEIELLLIPYEDCDIVDRKIHYPIGNCTLKALQSKILGITVNNDEVYDDVVYVYVFYSIMTPNIPIVFGISTGNDDNVNYYTGFNRVKKTYLLSSLVKVCKENLLDVLVDESDRINNTLTYLLDKRTNYNNIRVTKIKQGDGDLEVFKHTPTKKEPLKKSLLLLNYKKSITNPDISLKEIPELIVFWLDTTDNYMKKIPMLFECDIEGKHYCYARDSKDENKWTNIIYNNGHINPRRKREIYTETKDNNKESSEEVEERLPSEFNALFFGIIFFILFTIGFCILPLYKLCRSTKNKNLFKK